MNKKGPNFERDICKQLSLWWTDEERDDVFWRTSGSGARATTRRKKNIKTKYEYGDVAFTDPLGQPLIDTFLIELKRGYSNISILDFLDKKSGKDTLILQWWKKAEEERKFAKRKYSMIIFRRNRREACVLMERSLSGKLEYEGGIPMQWICISIESKDVMKFDIFLLNDFFIWVSPESIKSLAV